MTGLRGTRFWAPGSQLVLVKPLRMGCGWLALDACVVGIAVGADGVAGFADAEEIGEAEVGAGTEVFVVEAGLEAGHERSAGVHVVAELLALAIAEHGDIGQQQGAILGETFGIKAVFVDEVEGEAAAQQSLIDALRGLVHVLAGVRGGGAWVEELRALAHDDADVGDRAASLRWASWRAVHWK